MVRQIQRILFTTDLTKSAIQVFEQTVALAFQTGASVAMLHVIEDGSDSNQNRMVHLIDREEYNKIRSQSSDMIKNVLIGKQRAIPAIQNALREFGEKMSHRICGADNPVTIDAIEVRFGNVAEEIMAVSEQFYCDMIAIGYYKKGSLLKALMGSPGKSVIQQSRIPIFLVPLES